MTKIKSTLVSQCLKQLKDPLHLQSIYLQDHQAQLEVKNIWESLAKAERFLIPKDYLWV